MTFRVRLLLGFAVVAAVPLAVLAVGIRREVGARLSRQYEARVAALVTVIDADLAHRSDAVAARLAALAGSLPEDNRFRLGAVQGAAAERTYLLDYAGSAMRLAGLAMLQVQDSTGRILSSGQFRNDFDRLDPAPARGLTGVGPRPALVRARTPEGTFLALARVDSVTLAGRRLLLVGGVRVDATFLGDLARDPAAGVALVLPDTTLVGGADRPTPADALVDTLRLPLVEPASGDTVTASLLVVYPLAPLAALRASVDRWFLAALGITAVSVLLLAAWLAVRLSRPLRDLAGVAERVDLERGDVAFASDRRDEIGTLARLLGRMVTRLRIDAARLRDIERRATLGELARQVNHDIRNGLAPIRHVVRHLTQVAAQDPASLAAVYDERRATVESGIAYLENLAGNYARLHPQLHRQPCDLNAIVREVAAGAASDTVSVETAMSEPATLRTDPLVVRRILENLTRNAVEALGAGGGRVRLSTEQIPEGGVRLRVADTGPGMTRDQLDRAFEAFYTTKTVGTGLGLAIVRRLVTDLGGTLAVETAPGQGTTFSIDLPGSGSEEIRG